MLMSATKLLLSFFICRLISTVGLAVKMVDHPHDLDLDLLALEGQQHKLSTDPTDLEAASLDFGGMVRTRPLGVLHPTSADDVATIVRAVYESARGLTISAKGHGHSINGQAQTDNGVVIKMSNGDKAMRRRQPSSVVVGGSENKYVDVWGGELWIDVLTSTLEYGLAPKSWTDYLYLSVGGTLSNAGISGQAFHHGPQISNVYELDVVTGKGQLLTCSEEQNSELFHAVLGGLGQFGIITRARIAIEPAPQRVRWIRVLYSNFSSFTNDQEYLISLHGRPTSEKFDYVEGFVIVDEGLINNWRSSFFSPRNPVKITSISANGGVLYCLEITKNYDESTADTVDQEVEALMKKLSFIPASVFTTDLPYVDFLDRVHKAELKLRSKGLWDVPHPWLNLFVPKSRIDGFDQGVFKGILGYKTSGPILIYPMNKNKWDDRSSVVTVDEEVFYLVALLRSALDFGEETQSLDYLKDQNRQILDFCKDAGIGVKQYLPNYTTQQEWMDHFGDKWKLFLHRKMQFDPKRILAPGQLQISKAEARAVAAERQVRIREVRARDAQQQQGLKRKGKKKGPPSSEAPPPKKRSRAEGPSTEAVQALVASGHSLSTRDSSPVADFRSLRAGNVRAEVGFVPRWSIKEDDTLSDSHVARELVLKGSLPQDAAEAQRQGTAAMITSSCIFMAGAQNQVGQLAIRAEAMARDLEAFEREKSVLENERSVLLEKVEHLEEDLLRTSQEWDQKLAELKAQITTRVMEAETRGAEMYRASEGFWEEVKRAIAPGFTMGTTEVRDWILEHYPEVSFKDSGLIFEEECVEAAPTTTEVADVDGEGCSEEGEVQLQREVPLTPAHDGSDGEILHHADDEAVNPTDTP